MRYTFGGLCFVENQSENDPEDDDQPNGFHRVAKSQQNGWDNILKWQCNQSKEQRNQEDSQKSIVF